MAPFIVQKAKEVLSDAITSINKGKEPIVDTRLDLSNFRNIICLELCEPGRENVFNAIKELNKREDVLTATPDFVISIELPQTIESTNSEGTAVYTTWSEIDSLIDYTSALEVFDTIYNSLDFDKQEVRVAVLDTGIDNSHQDFNYNLDWDTSANFCNYSGDGEITEEDCVDAMLATKTDNNGHGTHVAGIIAKTTDSDMWEIPATNNLFGVVRFVSVKAFNQNGEAHATQIIAALNYINSYYGTSKEISIINFSASARWDFIYYDYVTALSTAIGNFQGLFVCAAGNDGMHIQNDLIYPAVLDADNIITVGASTKYDTMCTFSNYGSTAVDLFAPGESILSTFYVNSCNINTCETINNGEYADTHVDIDINGDGTIDNGYHSLSGTSMSTPFVSGVAALLFALRPDYSATQIKSIIIESVDPVTALQNKCVSGGRLNAYKAVMNIECSHTNVTYSRTTSQYYHNLTCSDCDCTFIESHSWIQQSTALYRCTLCGMLSDQDVILNLPPDNDEELTE